MHFFDFCYSSILIFLFVVVDSLEETDDGDFGEIALRPARGREQRMSVIRVGKKFDTELEEIKKSSSFAAFPRVGKMDPNYSWKSKNFDFLTEFEDRFQKRGDPNKAASNGMWFGPRIGRSGKDTVESQTETAYPIMYVMLNGDLLHQIPKGAFNGNSLFLKSERTEEK